jgi:hypothetical protein
LGFPYVSQDSSAARPKVGVGPDYFILGEVVPPAGGEYATWYQYFLDNNTSAGANKGNLMAGMKLPDGTITAYEYDFISRPDYSSTSCYLCLHRRAKYGALVANGAGTENRIWTYGYALTPAGTMTTASLWLVTVDNTSEPVQQKYYFNPFVPLGVNCSSGDCPGNGNEQRWRVGLLLKSETWNTSPSAIVESATYNYTRAVYDNVYYPYAYYDSTMGAQFLEHGYTPVLSSKTETLHLPGGNLARQTTYGNFDQYGNAGYQEVHDFAGALLRKTTTTFAWDSDANLKNLWIIRAPELSTVQDSANQDLQKVWHDYYTALTNPNHPGFPSKTRSWVSDLGSGPSSAYWAGEDYAYSSNDTQVTTTVGYASVVSRK